ncbi:uncharacterized protein N7479_009237 [Penicillium vulpinum]|uniref:FAD-binding domain-containing protein n=1 Tax=Penicillium vulpinum TaxID=29845 RepID=A0A1V6RVP2_9EURO|nr:uncharacterized protein N7479_009237 [Penicillium vulpinum]KAJ5950824.1 hypothetical protein N7479_009237 [Penicillium vulpinum]OQE05822.1 hypothetical protein PENVUL_c021G03430 [Penicillium vulpinum]
MTNPFVIIVGGGPSGILLALLLGKQGISVQLLEAAEKFDDRPRATHYGPTAVRELQRAGVFEDMKAKGGFFPSGVSWRKLHGETLAMIPGPTGEEKHPMICLPLNKLHEVLEGHLKNYPDIEVLFNNKVVSVGQDESTSWVIVETPEGKKTLNAQYIVGCDGASSIVRRSLFTNAGFDGFTWEEQLVATNVYYPFEKHGVDIDSTFIIHPEHYHMIARITDDGLWRVTYGELPGLTPEQLKERQPMKFKTMLPGHPNPEDYKLANFSPYKVHQRIATKMRVGRILLASDAAHLCNPFGGLGLTGGIVDIGGLYDCLFGVYSGQADESILTLYDEVRREKYNKIINPISSENLRRVFDQDPDTIMQRDGFLQLVKKAETDSATRDILRQGAFSIEYDFTQHYHSAKTNL